MSTARHHAEWLNLIEASGPFLSMPVLLRAFPQGLEAHDPDVAREVRLAYEEWLDNWQGLTKTPLRGKPDAAIHTAWIRFVLQRVLEMPAEGLAEGQAIPATIKATIAEQGETLRPDIVLTPSPSPSGRGESKPRLLIHAYPPSQDLEKPVAERRWKASPATRMMELLRTTDVRLGLVTNGERWMLVNAPRGGTSGFTSWYAGLWLEEPLTLRAFRTLLGARRFFGVADDETLEALLAESATDQQEVTAQLGYQVRRAVEVLIEAIDRADQDRGRKLLDGIGVETQHVASVLYEAALTVMMRLVVLLSAEERGLLLLGDPLYDAHYAVSTLHAQLRETADRYGEEVLAYRRDAWSRLLATFRAVYGGVKHENLHLPAYGGSLFDPERFPFLEGRTTTDDGRKTKQHSSFVIGHSSFDPLPINNRVVLHLLEALQFLQVKVPGGGPAEARRLSFRALDIEQIGHVYEGLLDHTAVRAVETVVGLAGTKDKEPEIALAELERRAKSKTPKPQTPKLPNSNEPSPEFIAYLREQTGRSESALRRALLADHAKRDPQYEARLRVACANDGSLFDRALPFANLLRDDDFGYSVIILSGSVYVTKGTDRRSSGTHYTPRAFTEPIVQRTLEPLVYVGPAEGLPRDQWRLRSPAELLALKICDMAMGSGAFLVQTCRWLAERLVEAWEAAEQTMNDERGTMNEADLSFIPLRFAPGTNVAHRPSLRITPEGKLSTGDPTETLIPVDSDERLAFARRIVADRCLYGVDKNPLAVEMAKLSLWLITLDKQRPFTFLDHALKCGDSLVGADEDMFLRWAHGLAKDAGHLTTMTLFDEELQKELQTSNDKRQMLESFEVKEVRDAERKQALLEEADAAMARVKLGCDLMIGTRLLDLKPKEKEARLNTLLLDYMAGLPMKSTEAGEALEAARKVRAFHWPFEFPEVFAKKRGGFSAFISNPPFMGGRNFTAQYGEAYAEGMRGLYPSGTGGADLCAYFFLRAFQHLQHGGAFGLIATNTIAQGDTRAVGLDDIVKHGGTIYNAMPSMGWPGVAAVFVSVVHLIKGAYQGEKRLDEISVAYISSLLDSTQSILGNPKRLQANADKSFQGSVLRGIGFVLEPEEAQALIDKDPKNRDVLFPYLNGEDLNSRHDQSPSRWAINFFDWPLEKAKQYPDCYQIVLERVKPQRDTQPNAVAKEFWWRYNHIGAALYRTIAPLRRVLVRTRVTKTHAPCFVAKGQIFSDATVTLAFDDYANYAAIQSSLHEYWSWTYASTMKTDLRYSPTDCFENFPFPQSPISNLQSLESLGETYHEHRRQIMLTRQEGLTKTYNRFHDPDEKSADIARLRELHVEMDKAVAAAYGWEELSGFGNPKGLSLGHGFHETAQGVRFTLSEAARREVLARLLKLNHVRWEEEREQKAEGARSEQKAVGSKGRKPKQKKAGGDGQESLL